MLPSSSGDNGSSGTSFGGSIREATRSVRAGMGLETEEEKNESCFPEMSYQTRIYGVMICFISGCVISILSSMFLWSARIVPFAILYSLGNVLAMFSSVFMMGIKKQCRVMWKKERIGATVIYLVAMIATLVIAFTVTHAAVPCLIMIIVQFCAGTWYVLSFIPFGRQAVLGACGCDSSSGGVAGTV